MASSSVGSKYNYAPADVSDDDDVNLTPEPQRQQAAYSRDWRTKKVIGGNHMTSESSGDELESNISRATSSEAATRSQTRYEVEEESAAAAAKGKKQRNGHKNQQQPLDQTITGYSDREDLTENSDAPVDTHRSEQHMQPFNCITDHQVPESTPSTSTSKHKSILPRESLGSTGKRLSGEGKLHETKQSERNEDEEPKSKTQSPDNRSSSRVSKNPVGWMKKRFRKSDNDQDGEYEVKLMGVYASPGTTCDQPLPSSTAVSYDMDAASPGIDIRERKTWIAEQEKKYNSSKMCMNVALTVILLGGIALGITLCAMSSLGVAFQILGPIILGLSCFALIYKLYLTMIWQEDPYAKVKDRILEILKQKQSGENTKMPLETMHA